VHTVLTPSLHPPPPPLPPKVTHQQELSRYGHLKTSSELQSMLAALQKEVDTNTGHARKAAVSQGGPGGESLQGQVLWRPACTEACTCM